MNVQKKEQKDKRPADNETTHSAEHRSLVFFLRCITSLCYRLRTLHTRPLALCTHLLLALSHRIIHLSRLHTHTALSYSNHPVSFLYMLPTKLARSTAAPPFPPLAPPMGGGAGKAHLLVILRRLVQNSRQPSPVMSTMLPYLDRLPKRPPNENGSARVWGVRGGIRECAVVPAGQHPLQFRPKHHPADCDPPRGTGTPMLTPDCRLFIYFK